MWPGHAGLCKPWDEFWAFILRTGKALYGILSKDFKHSFLVFRSSWPLVGRVVWSGVNVNVAGSADQGCVGSDSASLVAMGMGEEWADSRHTLAWGAGDERWEVMYDSQDSFSR